jgi:catechol 2,3-dioxygenase-like lactoylglutathione lyase family enzyme
MDNVGIVVEDIDAAIEFFTELGLELEARAPIEGDWADGVTGLRNMRVEIAMMRTPDGHYCKPRSGPAVFVAGL